MRDASRPPSPELATHALLDLAGIEAVKQIAPRFLHAGENRHLMCLDVSEGLDDRVMWRKIAALATHQQVAQRVLWSGRKLQWVVLGWLELGGVQAELTLDRAPGGQDLHQTLYHRAHNFADRSHYRGRLHRRKLYVVETGTRQERRDRVVGAG